MLLTATPALVHQSKIDIELRGLHVPAGTDAIPPPLNGLRIDPQLRRQLVTLCKSSKQTPTTAIADLVPDLKLAQGSLLPSPLAADHTSSGEGGGGSGGGGDHGGSGSSCNISAGTSGTSGEEPPPLNNTRFNPKPTVVGAALKRLRRELRGPVAVGDWERVNMLVREQLIQRDVRVLP